MGIGKNVAILTTGSPDGGWSGARKLLERPSIADRVAVLVTNYPNGSQGGNTAYADESGRHNIMMPHIERRNNASDTDWDGVFLNFRSFVEEKNQSK